MFNTLIFQPLYNLFVGIMDILPGIDVGIAVIIFTIIVRLILFPLSKNSLITQVKMKEIEPEAAKIRSQYADNKQLQALKVMELYKTKGVKPFAGVLLLIIQLPILFALISVFYKIIPNIQPEYLYSFIHVPTVKATLLGLDLTQKSIILSVMTAVLQFFQLQYSLSSNQQKSANEKVVQGGGKLDTASQITATMNTQMKFFLPIIAFVSTYWLIPARFPQAASIIAIYWSIGALFTLLQEIYIRKKHITKTA